MSELVMPANVADGGVFDTTRIFHAASAASIAPARRPTRGSGIGELDLLETAVAHPAAVRRASASETVTTGVAADRTALRRG
jgi:hypothetical protein